MRLAASLRASNHHMQEVTTAGSLALGSSQGGKLVLQGLCMINAPDRNVEHLLPRSVAITPGSARQSVWKRATRARMG